MHTLVHRKDYMKILKYVFVKKTKGKICIALSELTLTTKYTYMYMYATLQIFLIGDNRKQKIKNWNEVLRILNVFFFMKD